MSGDIHLPGWVGCCKSVANMACVWWAWTLWQSSVSARIHDCTVHYHAERKGVNCNRDAVIKG
jgi:hypothetical protein